MHQLILKPGREKSLKRRHPWIFSGGIARINGEPQPGDSVEVRAAGGELLAVAAYSPQSQIRARVWSWQPCAIDAAFISQRVAQAALRRNTLLVSGVTNAPFARRWTELTKC